MNASRQPRRDYGLCLCDRPRPTWCPEACIREPSTSSSSSTISPVSSWFASRWSSSNAASSPHGSQRGSRPCRILVVTTLFGGYDQPFLLPLPPCDRHSCVEGRFYTDQAQRVKLPKGWVEFHLHLRATRYVSAPRHATKYVKFGMAETFARWYDFVVYQDANLRSGLQRRLLASQHPAAGTRSHPNPDGDPDQVRLLASACLSVRDWHPRVEVRDGRHQLAAQGLASPTKEC